MNNNNNGFKSELYNLLLAIDKEVTEYNLAGTDHEKIFDFTMLCYDQLDNSPALAEYFKQEPLKDTLCLWQEYGIPFFESWLRHLKIHSLNFLPISLQAQVLWGFTLSFYATWRKDNTMDKSILMAAIDERLQTIENYKEHLKEFKIF